MNTPHLEPAMARLNAFAMHCTKADGAFLHALALAYGFEGPYQDAIKRLLADMDTVLAFVEGRDQLGPGPASIIRQGEPE
jgi:hypothetical protein